MILNKNITPKLSNNNNSKKHHGFRLKKYKKVGTFRKNRVNPNLRQITLKNNKGGALEKDNKRNRKVIRKKKQKQIDIKSSSNNQSKKKISLKNRPKIKINKSKKRSLPKTTSIITDDEPDWLTDASIKLEKLRRQNKEDENKAATKIQSVIRKNKAKKDIDNKNKAATKIQNIARRKKAKDKLDKLKEKDLQKRLDEIKYVNLPEYKSSGTQSEPLPDVRSTRTQPEAPVSTTSSGTQSEATVSTTSSGTQPEAPVSRSSSGRQPDSSNNEDNEFDNINKTIREEMIQTLNLISGELKQPDRTKILQQIQDKIKQIEILNKELDKVHRKQVENKNLTSQIDKRFKFDVVFDKAGNPALAGMSGGMPLGITTNQWLQQIKYKTIPSYPENIIVNSN